MRHCRDLQCIAAEESRLFGKPSRRDIISAATESCLSVAIMEEDGVKITFGDSQAITVGEAATDGHEMHVLAVDDCRVDRMVVERLLRSDSVKVTAVDSAAKALELLGVNKEHATATVCTNPLKFSLIITDYCMPELTGYDLLKRLKEIKGLKEIPVIIMSSENVPQRIQRCLDEGAEDFIVKPVQRDDIKKITGYIKVSKPVATTPICRKRKVSSVVLAGDNSERRPRISGVTVA